MNKDAQIVGNNFVLQEDSDKQLHHFNVTTLLWHNYKRQGQDSLQWLPVTSAVKQATMASAKKTSNYKLTSQL